MADIEKTAHILEITDLSDARLACYTRLSDNRLAAETGLFIAESPTVIRQALDAGCEPVSFLMEKKHVQGKGAPLIARSGEAPVFCADGELLAALTGFHLTRGMLCAMRRPKLPEAVAVCQNARRIAVLENVMNPENIGAIFRNAAALGVDALLVTDTGSDPLYRRALRVSMGTVFQLPWAVIPREGYVQRLHELGFKTAAMALRPDALRLDDPRLARETRLAILLGTEGDGLAQETIDACSYAVMIPMAHGVDSLNVAAASAVAFWQLCRR